MIRSVAFGDVRVPIDWLSSKWLPEIAPLLLSKKYVNLVIIYILLF